MPRYYIEEDENNPGQVFKRLIDGSYVNYNAAPIGAVEQCAGATIPPGWLQCNGQAVSRTYYSFLFNTIGTTYGAGDGTTTFNVPTMSNLVPNVKFMIKAESTLNGNYLGIEGGGATYADNPLGTILSFGGTTAPDGWELCHGQLLSRTEYADLFAVIGTNFGAGDGSTTFKLPDLRGEFLRGAGTNSHSFSYDGGQTTTREGDGGTVGQHQASTVAVPVFRWNEQIYFEKDTPWGLQSADRAVNGTAYQYAQNVPGGSASQSTTAYYTSRPTNTSVEFIIKVKKTDVPIDLMGSIKEMIAKSTMLTTEATTFTTTANQNPKLITLQNNYTSLIDFHISNDNSTWPTAGWLTAWRFEAPNKVYATLCTVYNGNQTTIYGGAPAIAYQATGYKQS